MTSEALVSSSDFKSCGPIYNGFGAKTIDDMKILDIGMKGGHTDYIDFIGVGDMKYSLMKGIDMFKRPFISVKVNYRKLDQTDVAQAVGTFFQRYSDEDIDWAYGTCYYLGIIYSDSRLRKTSYDEIQKLIVSLCAGEKVKTGMYSDVPEYEIWL